MIITQLLAPIIQLPGLLARIQPALLPTGIIGVLHSQRRPLRDLPLTARSVGRGQVFDNQADGPAVSEDVMQDDHQPVLLLIEAMQFQTQRRSGLQVECLARQGLGPLPRRGLVQFQVGQWLELCRVDPLLRFAVDVLGKGRSQRFVAGEQVIASLLQSVDIQQPPQTQHARQVIGRAVGFALPGNPQAALGARKR